MDGVVTVWSPSNADEIDGADADEASSGFVLELGDNFVYNKVRCHRNRTRVAVGWLVALTKFLKKAS